MSSFKIRNKMRTQPKCVHMCSTNLCVNWQRRASVACTSSLSLKPGFHSNAIARLRCLRCVNENHKKRKRLRWQAANHGCHCFDRAFLLTGAYARNVRRWKQRTQRKRLRLIVNWASVCVSDSVCLSVEPKRLKLQSPNLQQGQSTMCPLYTHLILGRSEGQGHRVTKCKHRADRRSSG